VSFLNSIGNDYNPKKRFTVWLAMLCFATSFFIYIAFLKPFPFINKLTSILSFEGTLSSFRNTMLPLEVPIWAVFYLPDGMWMLSFMLIMFWFWDFRINKKSVLCFQTSVSKG
jgi:hypothetical protein